MSDFAVYLASKDQTKRWEAERENASARLELAQINERCAMLVSQHQPVSEMEIDRERLRLILSFLRHGDTARLNREFTALQAQGAKP